MRPLLLATLLLWSCSGARRQTHRPPPGHPLGDARVALGGARPADRMWSDAAGAISYAGEDTAAGVVVMDWRAGTTTVLPEVGLYGPGPLLVRLSDATLEWSGGGPVPRPTGITSGNAWLSRTASPVPLVTSPAGDRLALDGFRSDGTRAWHIDPPISGKYKKLVVHLGDRVLIQGTEGYAGEGGGWHGGGTIMLDAATGKTLWQRPPPAAGFPAADQAAVHGDEIALMYEDPSRIEVIALADGAPRRSVKLDRTTMMIADHVGFDGDVMWSYRYVAPHDNPGNHMWGTGPRPDSPASCEYQAWDTRSDRGRMLRTLAELRPAWSEARGCPARAFLPLANGGVQVVVLGPEPDTAHAITFDRAP